MVPFRRSSHAGRCSYRTYPSLRAESTAHDGLTGERAHQTAIAGKDHEQDGNGNGADDCTLHRLASQLVLLLISVRNVDCGRPSLPLVQGEQGRQKEYKGGGEEKDLRAALGTVVRGRDARHMDERPRGRACLAHERRRDPRHRDKVCHSLSVHCQAPSLDVGHCRCRRVGTRLWTIRSLS